MFRIIPNRNKIFENEKEFLERQHRQGLKLKKKGWLLYQFTSATPKEVTYEIDLLPKQATDDELLVSGWEVVETESILYKGLKKVYYLNQNSEGRFIVDEKLRLDYYNREAFIWNILIIILLSSLLAFLFQNIRHLVPVALLFFLFVYSIKRAITFGRGRRLLAEKLGEEVNFLPLTFMLPHTGTLFGAYFLVHFSDLTSEQRDEIEESLSTIGTIVQSSGDRFYLKSSITRNEDLKQEILNITTIGEQNLQIVRAGSGSFFNTD